MLGLALTYTISNDDMYVVSDIVFHPKLAKQNIVDALKLSAQNLNSPLFMAEGYISKIDKFVIEECK